MTTLDKYSQFVLGLENLNRLTGTQNFPPYNVIKIDKSSYKIELAIAGFDKKDLSITLGGSILTISGSKTEKSDTSEFLYKGISDKSFTRTFTVADTMLVSSAEYVNGVLTIHLLKKVPETDKIKNITIV
jgi:molecular chaperone IbpA